MKKILALSLVISSIFSMQLDHVKPDKLQEKSSQYSYLNIDDVKKVHIQPSSVFVPDKLGAVELYLGKKGFSILQGDKKHKIQKCFTDPMLRNITRKQLDSFLETGYFSLNQMNGGEFSLKANGRIRGGGPLFGAFMYWATKSVCYGTAAVAVGTMTVTTAGVGVGVATSLASAGTGIAVASTIAAPAAIITTAGVGVASAATSTLVAGTGATLAAAVITGASSSGAVIAGVTLVEAATLTTAAGITAVAGTTTAASIGTGAACVIAIESLSTAVGTFFGMLPTP
jgi:hypothetical protein